MTVLQLDCALLSGHLAWWKMDEHGPSIDDPL